MILNHKPKDSEEKHNTGADRYLITYADLITLLLGLFVILYASSQIDEERFKEVSSALSEYFQSSPAGVLQGNNGVLNGIKSALPEPIIKQSSLNRNIDSIQKDTEKALEKYLKAGNLQVQRTSKGLTITLPEQLLFSSGSAFILNGGDDVLDTLASVLQGITYMVEVEGHTDSDPIRTFKFESNWHLSGARALNVAYKLIRAGVPESNMSFRGFGSQRPIADNSSLEGKSANRRVVINITELPPEAPSDNGYVERDSINLN